MNGEGDLKTNDGKRYKGCFVDDKKEGYGEMYFPDHSVYSG